MALMKVYNGVLKDSKSQVVDHNDTFHLISEELELESYSVSDGVITNFMRKAEVGTGTVTETAATHSFEFTTGVSAAAAEASLYTRDTWTLGEDTIIASFKLDSHVVGAGAGQRVTQLGFLDIVGVATIAFVCNDAGQWSAYLHDGIASQSTNITIAGTPTLTVSANRNRQAFYVDGMKIVEYANANIAVTYATFATIFSTVSAAVARTMSISNFDISIRVKPSRPKKL